jgi:hypothetical protein
MACFRRNGQRYEVNKGKEEQRREMTIGWANKRNGKEIWRNWKKDKCMTYSSICMHVSQYASMSSEVIVSKQGNVCILH